MGLKLFKSRTSSIGVKKLTQSKHDGGDQRTETCSIGSTLSPNDQFDIMVPVRKRMSPTTVRYFSQDYDNDTEVSSLSADGRRCRSMSKSPATVKRDARSHNSSSWCCCTPSTTEATLADESHIYSSTQATAKQPMPANSDSMRNRFCCIGGGDANVLTDSIVEVPKNRNTRNAVGPSLFDNLSENGDNDVQNTTGRKRWRTFGMKIRRRKQKRLSALEAESSFGF